MRRHGNRSNGTALDERISIAGLHAERATLIADNCPDDGTAVLEMKFVRANGEASEGQRNCEDQARSSHTEKYGKSRTARQAEKRNGADCGS